jgi:hypothetical protein
MIFLLVTGALIVGAPILAAILVAIASLREDAERSLTGRAPGQLAAAARRLLSVRTESVRAADSGPASGPATIDDVIFEPAWRLRRRRWAALPHRRQSWGGTVTATPNGRVPANPPPTGTARPGTARPGTAPPGTAPPGTARPGSALARVPAPRLADRDQASDFLPIP